MSRSPIHQLVSVVVVTLVLAACAPQEPERQSLSDLLAQAQEPDAAAAADEHDHSAHDHGAHDAGETAEVTDGSVAGASHDAGEPGSEPASPAASGPGSEPTGDPSPDPGSEQPSAQPAGPTMEQYDDFPIIVTLGSTCVEQGGEMTVLVDAGRKHTGVVYIAIYDGEESGAPPPYGDGHGGNSGDMTDDDGYYEDTWVVAPDAPVGPARVEVMAGRDGAKSTDLARFEVVGSGSGGC